MRQKKRNKIIIIVLACIICLMGVGYAAFSTRLDIKGTSSIDSNWDIRITNVTESNKGGEGESAKAPSWTDLTANMEANLYNKGDYVEYEVTIENRGTFDAKLDDVITNVTSNNEAVKITFSGYTKGQTLYKNSKQVITVKVEYNPDYEGDASGTSGEVSVDFEYTQNEGGTIVPTEDYLVTYDCSTNGGNSCNGYNEYLPIESTVNLSYSSEKTGYDFVGWNTDSNAKEGLENITVDKDITLYAIFKKDINVTYEKGSNVNTIGKTSDTCRMYNNDESCTITLPSITPNNGYSSVGWSTTNNDTTGIAAESSATIIEDTTYYANAIDNIAPTTPEITNSSNGNWSNGNVTVTIISTDEGSGIDYYEWNNNGTWTSEGITITDDSGEITFTEAIDETIEFRAVDKAGNVSSISTTQVKIDRTTPTLTLSTSSTTNSIAVSANAEAVSGISKYEYKIDNGDWMTGDSNTYTFTGLNQNTSYEIEVRVTSGSGNAVTETITATTMSLPLPTFSESETTSGKNITITYPEGCGSTYTCTYIRNGGNPVTVTRTTRTVSFTSSGNLIATVSDGTNEVSNVYNVEILPVMQRWSSSASTDFHSSTYKSKITSAEVVDYKEVPSNAVDSWDVSANKDGSVMAWVIDDPENSGYYKLYIGGDGGVKANFDSSYIFYRFSGLQTVDLTKLDTSNVTNMIRMFYNCSGLERLDISGFNTSKVIDMSYMFSGCSGLTNLDVSDWDTGKVTSMISMFSGCSSLTSLDVSDWNTNNVTSMSSMFYNCSRLTSLDVSDFKTSNVTNMHGMFESCSKLTKLNVSAWDTSKVTNMYHMFYNCNNLTSLNLSNFNTSKVTDMNAMFYECNSLTSLDVSNFDTSNITNMSYMFRNCNQLTSLDLSSFDTSNVTSMYAMFQSASKLKVIYVGPNWTMKNVTNSTFMFDGCGVSSVTRK